MPRKLFGLIGGVSAAAASADEALLRQIAQQRDSDPLIGAKIGGREITQQLFTKMNSERGFHIESMLCALGALAGHACQASIRARNVARGVPEMTDLVAVDTPDDRRYFFGDAINHPLSEAQYSIRKPVAGQAQQSACGQLPDVGEIFRHAAETVGSEAFGQLRVPPQHLPHRQPNNYLRTLWPELLPRIRRFCPEPGHWPVLLGFSIQEVIDQGKSVLDPCLAARLVMESAIPASNENLPYLAT